MHGLFRIEIFAQSGAGNLFGPLISGLFKWLCLDFYFETRIYKWYVISYCPHNMWHIIRDTTYRLNVNFLLTMTFWPSFRHVFKSGSLVLSKYYWDDLKAKQNDSTHLNSISWTFLPCGNMFPSWKLINSKLVDCQKSVAGTSVVHDLFNNF